MYNDMILYPDTEKELFFDNDYKPIPELTNLDCTQLQALLENVFAACGNAFLNGADMLEIALTDDIIKINRQRFANYLRTISAGHVATVIHNDKYTEIDKAILAAWKLFNNTGLEECIFFEMGTDIAGLDAAILQAYQAEKEQERQVN